MKILKTFFCCLIITSLCNVVLSQSNLVLNPGFESGSTSWSTYGTGVISSTSPYEGTKCGRVGSTQSIDQVVSGLSPNTTYILTAMFKGDLDSVSVGAKNYNGTASTSRYTKSKNWVSTGEISFTTGATSTSARIFMYGPTNCAGYADNFTLTMVAPDIQAPTIPTNLTASNINTNSFTMSWSASVDNKGVTGYYVYLNGGFYTSTTSTSLNISGLVPSTNYSITVKSKDAAGNISAASSALVVTTAAIQTPTNLTTSNLISTSFTLLWTASTDNVVTGYDVYLNGSLYGSTTENSYSITSLIPMTSYNLYVVAKDASGNKSTQSSVLSVTTPAIPYKPLNLNYSALTQTTFTLSWTPSPDNAGVTSYDIYKDGVLVGNTTATSFNLTGLPASSTYAMTVISKDASGNNKATSNVLNVTTNPAYNLVFNGSFENGTTPWTTSGTCSIKSTKPFVGFYSCYAANGGGISQTVTNLKPNTSYTLIAQLKADTGSISMGAKTFGGTDLVFTTTNRIWTRASLTFTTGASNTSAIIYLSAPTGAGNIGYGDAYSLEVTNPSDTQLPTAPTNLASSNIGTTTFTLSWTQATDNVGVYDYEVLKNGVSIGMTTGITMNITDLNTASTNSFQVIARDYCGNATTSTSYNVTTIANTYTSSPNLFGINLRWSWQDYSEDRMFADVIKTCRHFAVTGTNGGGVNVAVDANGWPNTDFEVVLWHGIANMHGTYKLSFVCSNPSTINFGFSWTGSTITNKLIKDSTLTCDVAIPSNGLDSHGNPNMTGALMFFYNTNGGVRNIKMMRPVTLGSPVSYPAGTLFTDQIQNLVAKFSTIRFMDYFATNSNDMVTWSQRTMPNFPSQNKSFGGSCEYAIMLCNAKGKDMWLNIPLKVDSTFIVNLAKLVKYGSDGVNPYSSVQANPVFPPLNSGLHLYIEYSNEVWNTAAAFKQGNDNYSLAVAEVTAGNSPLNFDLVANNGWGWAARRVGKKIVEISNIFRSVWGDAAMMTTVRPVLQGQQGTCSTSALIFIDQVYSNNSAWCSTPHPINYYLYGTGGSGYYGPNNNDLTLTIDNFWSSSSMKSSTFTSNMRKESAVAHAFGLKRVCYEGGPSMDPANNPASAHVDSVKAQAYNDPRMKASMVNLFDNAWSATGSDLLVYYCSTGFINEYAWSFTNDIFNLNTPKLQGIDQLNSVNKVAPTICSVPPCTLLGNNCESNFALGTYSYFNGSALHVKQNSYSIFMFRITTAGTYNVSAKLNANTGPLRIVVDGVLLGSETVSGTLPSYTMANLQPGLHTVMFKTSTGETEFVTVTINLGVGQKGITTSINNAVEKNKIKLYPNPATDFVNINLANENESATVVICEITGKVVFKKQITSHQSICQINTESLTNGAYIVNVLNGSNSWSGKLCICK